MQETILSNQMPNIECTVIAYFRVCLGEHPVKAT